MTVLQRIRESLVNMEGSNSGKINLDRRTLDAIGQESSKQTERPFICGTWRSGRMELAQLMTEADELPLSRGVRVAGRGGKTLCQEREALLL